MLLELLFDEDDLGGTGATFGYDAVENGVYIFSFLDSDLFRLNRFQSSVKILKCDAMVICFPEQYQFLKSFLDKRIKLKTVSMDAVLQSLPIEGSNAYE